MNKLTSIEELAQPELRLAGIRINPRTHSPSRSSYYTALKLLNIEDGNEVSIKALPENAKIRNVVWSPNGKHIAFVITRENGQDLWVADVHKGSARKLISEKVSSVYGSPFVWLPDSETLICKNVPEDIRPTLAMPMVP